MSMFTAVQNIDSHQAAHRQARIHGPITRRSGDDRCGMQAR